MSTIKKVTTLAFVITAPEFPDPVIGEDGEHRAEWTHQIEDFIEGLVKGAQVVEVTIHGITEDGYFTEDYEELDEEEGAKALEDTLEERAQSLGFKDYAALKASYDG
jgi:hypothetical protein